MTRVKEALSGCPDSLWHLLTMKKIGMRVGSLINRMNMQYVGRTEPSYFDAQDFLWPEKETDNLVLTEFSQNREEVLQELQASRKTMVREIFSGHTKEAHNQIYRMFGRDYINALELRLNYDVEFSGGVLDYDPIDDISELEKAMLCSVYPRNKARKQMNKAKGKLKILEAFLSRNIPSLIENPLNLRTARICFYLDRFDIQKIVKGNPERAIAIIHDYIIPAERRYSQRICLLRHHYELTRLQLLSYQYYKE